MHWGDGCLVPRSHYSARPKSFESRGPSESLKRIDREGQGKRCTVTGKGDRTPDIYTQARRVTFEIKMAARKGRKFFTN